MSRKSSKQEEDAVQKSAKDPLATQRKARQTKGSTIQKPREDLIKLYTDRFWSGISKTNTALLTWIAALLLIIFSIIYPAASKLIEKSENNTKKENIEISLKRLKNKYDEKLAKTDKNISQINKTAENFLQTKNELKVREQELKEISEELAEFPIPFGKLPIPKKYSPIVWSFLFAALLGFFLFTRIKLHSTLGKIIYINVNQCGKRVEEMKGSGNGVSFWLAPLPKSIKTVDGEIISKEDLIEFLGWKEDEQRYRILIYFCLFLSSLFFLWVIWLTFEIGYAVEPNNEISSFGIRSIVTISFIFFGCAVACFYWLCPKIKLGEFSSRVHEESKSRRYFLKAAGAIIGLGFVYVLIPRKANTKDNERAFSKKRFKTEKKYEFPAQFRNNFWTNIKQEKYSSEKSLVMHYIGVNGLAAKGIYLKTLKEKSREEVINLQKKLIELLNKKSKDTNNQNKTMPEKTPFTQNSSLVAMPSENSIVAEQSKNSNKPVPPPSNNSNVNVSNANKPNSKPKDETLKPSLPHHLNPQQLSAITECLALEQLQKVDIDSALDLLWNGIVQDTYYKKRNGKKPDYRLYDLLVGLSFKYSKEDYKTKLNEHIQKEWANDKQLNNRKQNWSNPKERWLTKWSPQQPLNWKHSFYNWKTSTKNEASVYSGYFG